MVLDTDLLMRFETTELQAKSKYARLHYNTACAVAHTFSLGFVFLYRRPDADSVAGPSLASVPNCQDF